MLHVYIQQPWSDRLPGANAWFGTEFNRNNTWFTEGKAWIDYLRPLPMDAGAGEQRGRRCLFHRRGYA